MHKQVRNVLLLVVAWVVFFFWNFAIDSDVKVVTAALVSSALSFILLITIFILSMLDRISTEISEETLKYYEGKEEASAVAQMGEDNPDILLLGFEYCKIDAEYGTYDKHYFSLNDKKIVKDKKTTPQGDDWICVRYYSDREVTHFLYYRRIKK